MVTDGSIRDIGFNAFETTLMDVVRNVFQMIGVIGAGYFATKVQNSRFEFPLLANLQLGSSCARLAMLSASRQQLVWPICPNFPNGVHWSHCGLPISSLSVSSWAWL